MSNSHVDEPDQPPADDLGDRIEDAFDKIDDYLKMTRSKGLIRRYFAMNAFDGAMTSLGVVIGSYIAGIENPRSVMEVLILGGVAMMISGFMGTYMVESAERRRSLNELRERGELRVDDPELLRATRFVTVFAAVVDGSAPFLASLPSLLPFVLVIYGFVEIHFAFALAVAMMLVTLFMVGAFLGRISDTNLVYSGLKMVVAGAIVAMIALILGQ